MEENYVGLFDTIAHEYGHQVVDADLDPLWGKEVFHISREEVGPEGLKECGEEECAYCNPHHELHGKVSPHSRQIDPDDDSWFAEKVYFHFKPSDYEPYSKMMQSGELDFKNEFAAFMVQTNGDFDRSKVLLQSIHRAIAGFSVNCRLILTERFQTKLLMITFQHWTLKTTWTF